MECVNLFPCQARPHSMIMPIFASLVLAQMPMMSLKRDVVTMDATTTFALAPPLCVYSPTALSFDWCPTGRYVLVHGAVLESFSPVGEQKGKIRIEVIEWRTGKRELIGEVVADRNAMRAEWASEDSLLVSEAVLIPSGPTRPEPGSRSTLSLRRLGSTSATKLYDTDQGESYLSVPTATVSKHGYAVIYAIRNSSVEYIHVNLRTLKKTSPPYPRAMLRLDSEGYVVYDEFKDRKDTGMMIRYLPDGQTVTVPATPPAKEGPQPLQLAPSRVQHKAGKKTEEVLGLWLMATLPSEFQFALVSPSADVRTSKIAPDRSAIAYMDRGNVFVREMIKLDTKEFTALLEREEQQDAITKAKQIATAIHIYMADWDDVFPGADGFNDKMMPYLKNRQMLDGFVYTFSDRKATDIAEPSKTEIGYVDGRRGRAVAYADGSVKWIKNP